MWSSGHGPLQITRCGLEGISPCCPLGEFWRGSVGVVQWAWSSGCSPGGVSQDESVNTREPRGVVWKGTVGVVLWGISGCGLEENSVCSRNNHWVQYSRNH